MMIVIFPNAIVRLITNIPVCHHTVVMNASKKMAMHLAMANTLPAVMVLARAVLLSLTLGVVEDQLKTIVGILVIIPMSLVVIRQQVRLGARVVLIAVVMVAAELVSVVRLVIHLLHLAQVTAATQVTAAIVATQVTAAIVATQVTAATLAMAAAVELVLPVRRTPMVGVTS